MAAGLAVTTPGQERLNLTALLVRLRLLIFAVTPLCWPGS
jgi:hypothetical protein